ncbi:hypothetical protein [Paenibacillus agaridevorans]|uniref:hypothetical protein n=1 Tax=Paenibacillus agaridevorans TaxID=171404 RepID=UPI001BE48118|nr:hypothetical protein [Paenibacillus agaridevorans]
MSTLYIKDSPFMEGFSAYLASQTVSTSAQLTNWDLTAPFFGSPDFNATSGNYTVPVTGRYWIAATVNYSLNNPVTLGIGGSVYPNFQVRRSLPVSTILVSSLLPVLNLNVTLLNIRAVLGNAGVTLAGEADLTAGDVIGLYYAANGLTLTLSIGLGAVNGVMWIVQRLT